MGKRLNKPKTNTIADKAMESKRKPWPYLIHTDDLLK